MILTDDVMPLLAAAVPSFADVWRELAEDVEDDGTRLHHSDAGRFARHLLELHRTGETSELRAAFAVIERLYVEGDDHVRGLATTGYLEGVQNISSHTSDVPAAAFEPYLGPESRRHWDALNEFWAGGSTA